ncbi:MAG TPA: tRNA pseudouridine(55) synthase TruB [Allosphingosinicella sp.]|nr:tRNA pseudouridine(55) synthase TruB [Allosphingosinicella sp.]
MHGWLIIDKPVGLASTQAVAAVKRALREGGYPKVKVGHGGTLDPLASGVLPVALGEATKLCGRMLNADKDYGFTIRFGEETDTLDAEGSVIARGEARPTLAQVEGVLARFTGAIDQVPPAYSALKVEGRRAYARVRAGEAVALESRRVIVRTLSIEHSSLRWNGGNGLEEVTLAATVSKGTYIRSLARDIARALGTVGQVAMLRRTRAGPFTLDGAISLDKLAQHAKARSLENSLLPLAAGLDDIPALPVAPDQARALRQGRKAIGTAAKPGLYLATDDDVPVALVELGEGELRVVRGFNL